MSFGGPRGERVRANGLFDTGAGVGAMDTSWYKTRAGRLGELGIPRRKVRTANGTLVDTAGQWIGKAEIDGLYIDAVFDVFDSGGSWDVLVGLPVQAAFGVVHDTKADAVTIHVDRRS
ncbi:hypothetical protein B0H19DRAFT_931572, partial [Mycena capillaripes]